ncbi:GerA spore germination protein [Paenibacillus sp. yr247]|uniref:spore germination protein n=1 Tax=Paenibacillus sp. yr247 TaxID=1761880 RepID=UPI00089218A5|nr:spore germination protein [Paenibacillus sp. yr247]SDO50348.1 GerA spore germination protein [Paenibacillus sp. yr247]
MFWKKLKIGHHFEKPEPQNTVLTIDSFRQILANMDDAEIIERRTNNDQMVMFLYIRTLIDQERLNESVIEPLLHCDLEEINECIATAKVSRIVTMEEGQQKLLTGSILLYEPMKNHWWAALLPNPLTRAIETSDTETIMFGPKDSFSEQIDQNVTMIRRRLPSTSLKSERFSVGSVSKTEVVMMYMEGVTNPEFISIARSRLSTIDFDVFMDSSHVAAFMEDHYHSIFPQFQQSDRPDLCAFTLSMGKITFLVANTPFALTAPITFFHLFQSPEDYINRWLVASFLRLLRYVSYVLSLILVPIYVALATHHYQMLPMQVLFVLLESRTKLPFTPFWEAFLMLLTLEIIKEASLRMPTKSGQVLGVIGGIVVGQASVEAGFASKILIVLVGVTAIASFLVPNYLVTKSNTLLQFAFLFLANYIGMLGIVFGIIVILVHLNSITSLKQPYLAPLAPLYWRDWLDLFIRGPFHWMKERPEYLHTLQKWRTSQRRK